MFLSCLLINIGDNPDREDWKNRNWLRNRYRVHQRLCMAFPSAEQRKQDPEFLMPYEPYGFMDPQADSCSAHVGQTDPPRRVRRPQ